jgi:hypothetical protein
MGDGDAFLIQWQPGYHKITRRQTAEGRAGARPAGASATMQAASAHRAARGERHALNHVTPLESEMLETGLSISSTRTSGQYVKFGHSLIIADWLRCLSSR